MELELPNKNAFFDNYIIHIFLSTTAIILLLVMTIVMYIFC